MSKVAFFDFDGTLAHSDSLLPFLCRVAGYPRCAFAFLQAVFLSLFLPRASDRRTFIKEKILFDLLKGKHVAVLAPSVEQMRTWPCWIESSVQALRAHHAQGHKIVVATGSLDLYIGAMLAGLPVDDVLCTRMEVVDGVLTGRMDGGNCVRQRKASLVASYLLEHGPFDESWAYGNAPHDVPMMEKTTHRIVV